MVAAQSTRAKHIWTNFLGNYSLSCILIAARMTQPLYIATMHASCLLLCENLIYLSKYPAYRYPPGISRAMIWDIHGYIKHNTHVRLSGLTTSMPP
jgi:hypothetical protein